MTAATSETARSTQQLDDLRCLLRDRFDTEVDLFFDSPWRDSEGKAVADSARLDEVWRARAPQIDQYSHLSIPIDDGRGPMVAVCNGAFPDERLAVEVAKATLDNFDTSKQVEELSVEVEFFAQQVTVDFEELTFLRRIPEMLDFSEASRGLLEVAQQVLTSLGELIGSEGIVLFANGDDNPFDDGIDSSLSHWVGAPQFSDQQAARLVELYGSQTQELPFVQNNFQQLDASAEFPSELNEFILVPVCKSDWLMGWIVVANRATGRDASWRAQASEWELIDLEFGTIEATLVASTASILATQVSNVQHLREKEELLTRFVRVMVSAIEAKDKSTCGHSERVALFGRQLAENLGYGAESCDRLYLAGLLHDVGKIGVSDAILTKPGQLSTEEFEEIKKHPHKGWEILQGLHQLNYVLPGVLCHHERVDGRGYPDALVGDEIPADGRILAVAVAYDAMTSDRPYRKGMPQEKAEQILRDGAGTQWDERVVEAFLSIMDEIVEIRETYQREPEIRRDPAETDRMESALLESL